MNRVTMTPVPKFPLYKHCGAGENATVPDLKERRQHETAASGRIEEQDDGDRRG
jgi:hypothetical protein